MRSLSLLKIPFMNLGKLLNYEAKFFWHYTTTTTTTTLCSSVLSKSIIRILATVNIFFV